MSVIVYEVFGTSASLLPLRRTFEPARVCTTYLGIAIMDFESLEVKGMAKLKSTLAINLVTERVLIPRHYHRTLCTGTRSDQSPFPWLLARGIIWRSSTLHEQQATHSSVVSHAATLVVQLGRKHLFQYLSSLLLPRSFHHTTGS